MKMYLPPTCILRYVRPKNKMNVHAFMINLINRCQTIDIQEKLKL